MTHVSRTFCCVRETPVHMVLRGTGFHTVHSLVLTGSARNLEKPVLWARECPLNLPEILNILTAA
jgi:hypothetical protein